MPEPDDPTDCTEPGAPAREADGAAHSVYGRWSRRKARARAAPAPVAASAADPAPRPAAEAAPPSDAAPRELTDADMPALDALGEDDDYSGFLSPGVSEPLRLEALRKLFASAKFNVVDGLDDYAEDFTSFEPLGDIVTSDMRHRIEMEAERARLAAEQQARDRMTAGDGVEAEADEGVEAGAQAEALADGSEPTSAPTATQAAAPTRDEEHARDEKRARGEELPAALAPPAADASAGSNAAPATALDEAPARRVRDDG